ncbi:RNA polymerase sigma-54 factor [Enterococcus pernyi]|uniref:RNA polymerase factor sigma-54 n=1 Tax=Enterococcus mundtii TaxID=53346 RepID=A0A1V2UMK3_ENTMU|nr:MULTISPECIES: RNA polymerase factor sigma-54 [Enterococcus]MBE6172646.1 RNA polymerase factor sigma-54 [Enterococcus faecium]NMP57013.1 RNA polymerase factor sigma-54 [Enterococcus mundtii]ONN44669.1 RNA polymerase sigma-54 factor [Enterococcus mundtii]PTO37340.1 RNA polymerase sigma-54 factor [Enterococcus mundtii]
MKFEQNFSQKQQQTQKLAMTQQLQQSIQVLQYNSEELLAFVENQALENPLVEVIEPDWQPDYQKRNASYEGEETSYLNQIPDTTGSLFESLIEQVHLNYRDTFLRKLILYLIEYIDLNGFLTISLEDAIQQTNATPIQMLDALTLIQQLEPAGVGARSLQECLMLQTERDDYAPELAYIVLEEWFDQLVERKWKEIAQHFAIPLSDVQRIFDYIQTLSPSPGRVFDHSSGLYIIPDVKVVVIGEEVQVISNRGNQPNVRFQEAYFQQMQKKADKETQAYLKERKQEFEWLQKTILQRGDTIMRVAQIIVSRQKEFFTNVARPIRPLTLKEVAEEIDVHESTVSRAVNGKYLETDFGVFELKKFFTTRLQPTNAESTEDLSADTAKKKVQELVDAEDKSKPLSDQKLVELLKNDKISISRRTVAKYRDLLGIPSSSKRKRYDK